MASLYDSIAEANQDTSLNRYSIFGRVTHRRLKSLDVISIADYDADHPAGTPLNDLMTVFFESADEFIHNGYSFVGTGMSDRGAIEPLTLFNAKRRRLLRAYFRFYLQQPPSESGTHQFTVIYTNEDDVVSSATSQVIHIEGASND